MTAGGYKKRPSGTLVEAQSRLVTMAGGLHRAGDIADRSKSQVARYTDPAEFQPMPADVIRILEREAGQSVVSAFLAAEAGALAGRGLELAYVADPVDAFFAQVQGSARLRLEDGTTVRISYHGKTGHPYTAIGRVLIDRGVLPEGGASMRTIRAALAADPALVAPVLSANRSYVFFRERPSLGEDLGPIAAAGLPLVPWRSLAVDRAHIALGTPVFVETQVPGHGRFADVMIAEDTGSAIKGPVRGDMFIGSGDAAGAIAGEMKAAARLTLIRPRLAS